MWAKESSRAPTRQRTNSSPSPMKKNTCSKFWIVNGYGKCGDFRSITKAAARESGSSTPVKIAMNSTASAAALAMVTRRSGNTQNGWR